MRAVFVSVVALSVLSNGCKDQSPRTEPERTPPVDEATVVLLEAAGDRAPLVVLVRPDRWASLHEGVATVAAGLPDRARALLAKVDTFDAAVALAAAHYGLKRAPDLTALDRARPIVAAIGVTNHQGPPGSVATKFDLEAPLAAPAHHILLPATDPAALAAALSAALPPVPIGDPRASVVPGSIGAISAERIPEHGLRAEVVAEADRVRVVLQPAINRPGPAASAGPPAARTPALLALASQVQTVGALVRPDRLRGAWAVHGAAQNAFWLNARPIQRHARRRIVSGTRGSILRDELLMAETPSGMEELALRADAGVLRLLAVASLESTTAEALAKATRGAPPPTGVRIEAPAEGIRRPGTWPS